MKVAKCIRRLVKAARAQGWEVKMTGGGHLRFSSPDGSIVFTSSTPSCPRAAKNCRAELRRKGLDV